MLEKFKEDWESLINRLRAKKVMHCIYLKGFPKKFIERFDDGSFGSRMSLDSPIARIFDETGMEIYLYKIRPFQKLKSRSDYEYEQSLQRMLGVLSPKESARQEAKKRARAYLDLYEKNRIRRGH